MAKQFLIIGAGRFGASVAKTLYGLGHDVMVVDIDEEIIQNISGDVTSAVQADAASEKALHSLAIGNYDAVVLAISSDMHSSIMAAILLIEMGARYVVAKAQTDLHGRVLKKLGVNRVVYPEQDMGNKLAHSILAPSIVDLFELSDAYSVVEVNASEEMSGKTLGALDLRARHGVSVIAIRSSNGGEINISPAAEDLIEPDDLVIAIGNNKDLKGLGWI